MGALVPWNGSIALAPGHLVEAREAAYRRYGDLSTRAGDQADGRTAQALAAASVDVAAAWRDLASQGQLSWWVLAAVTAAIEGFEEQALLWQARSDNEEGQGYGVLRDVGPRAGSGRGNAGRRNPPQPTRARDVPGPGQHRDHDTGWPG